MSAPRTPPRNVPTLTEVVRQAPTASVESARSREERLVQRVLHSVEADLDQRLREAVASLVLEQTQSLGPQLRRELQASVREAVARALAQEPPLPGASDNG